MPEIEDDLKLQNWLSILTYDIFKYVRAGGVVVVEWTDDGLIVRFPAVTRDSRHVNSRFHALAAEQVVTAAPEEPAP